MTRIFRSDAYDHQGRALEAVAKLPLHREMRAAQCLTFASFPVAENAPLTLRLGKDFAVVGADGKPLTLSTKRGKLMLAMLACGPNMARSRAWLRCTLWHRAFTAQGYGSLRQCLHNVRHALGPHGSCLRADRNSVWLEAVRIDWAESAMDPSLFLANNPGIEGPVQEWLDHQRQRFAVSKH